MTSFPSPESIRHATPLVIGVISTHALVGELLTAEVERRGHRVVRIRAPGHPHPAIRLPPCDVVVICSWGSARPGRHLARSLCCTYSTARVVVILDSSIESEGHRTLLAGTTSVIGADDSLDEAVAMIEMTARGDSILGTANPAISMTVPSTGALSLTAREVEILQLTVDGRTVSSIAEALIISPKTVKHHLSAIYTKLGVDNRTAAVVHAVRAGVISLD